MERRVPLAHQPTPVDAVDRLGAALGLRAGRLLVKRDDLTGLGGGGNKARKLEYLCADAQRLGCDTLVTGGGRQSNHARTTAAAAARTGMACALVLASDPPAGPTGNVVLDHLLGAAVVWAGPLDHAGTEAAITRECDRLAGAGHRPYRVPVGGASALGCAGYVRAAAELLEQVPDLGAVVVAGGTGGTHAGLAVGLGGFDRVIGVDVGARPDLTAAVAELAVDTAALLGVPPPQGGPRVDGGQVGDSYGAVTDACREALRLAARTEGLLLDPVYTSKAMAGLAAAAGAGTLPPRGRIVFLHTGGLPALFAPRYAAWATTPAER